MTLGHYFLAETVAEPKVRSEPWLRPNEKFDFAFWLIFGLTWF